MAEAFDLDQIGGAQALHALRDEVLRVGALALAHFHKGVTPDIKPDRSPVTVADKEVEDELRRYIDKAFVGAAFYGEETGEDTHAADLRFVVDPIDGTRAFVRQMPTWSVLVGVEWKGLPVAGIAYMPAAEDLFVGAIGSSVTHNDTPVRLSTVQHLEDAMVCHGVLQQFTEAGIDSVLSGLGNAADQCRGQADFDGYKQLLLGRADAMADPGVQPYDICAAAALVRAAGGRFTTLDGKETIYGNGGLASNGLVHDELLAVTRGG